MKQKLAIANALLPRPALLSSTSRPPASTSSRAARSGTLLDEAQRATRSSSSARATSTRPSSLRPARLSRRRAASSPTGTPAELRAAVPLELYRAWGDDARAIARGGARAAVRRRARAPPAASRASRCGATRSPDAARACSRDLAALPAPASASPSSAPLDMESTLLALSRERLASMTPIIRDARAHASASATSPPSTTLDLAVEPGIDLRVPRRQRLGQEHDHPHADRRCSSRPRATIEVDGVDVIRHPRRVRDRIGYMGQKVSLYQGLSLRENVEFYAGLYGLEGARLERALGRAARALRARRGGGRAARGPARRHPPARRASRSARCTSRACSSSTSRPPASTSRSRGLFWELIQDEADARRHGLRHHALPRGGRLLRLGVVHRRRPPDRRTPTPEELAPALLGRLSRSTSTRRRRARARRRSRRSRRGRRRRSPDGASRSRVAGARRPTCSRALDAARPRTRGARAHRAAGR